MNRSGTRLPFPTIDRSVSGRRNESSTNNIELYAVMNQKIDLQPRDPASTPPIIGPIAIEISVIPWKKPMYPPRSARVVISPTTPDPIAIVLALPALCKHRSTSSVA